MSFQKAQKNTAESCRRHWNLMNDKKFGSFKLQKLKYRRGDQIIQPFCRIGCPQEIRSPLFNLRKFQKRKKGTSASCRTHWNPMNDEEFEFFKPVKWKYRRGNRIGSAKEIRSPLFNWRKFWKAQKSTAEWCRRH